MIRRIAYIPFDETNRNNAYAFRMRDILGRLGEVGAFVGVKAFVRGSLRLAPPRVDLLVLNWVEGGLLDSSGRFSLRAALKLWLRLSLMRLAARRLVFVRHNHYPHATPAADVKRVQAWVDRLERRCDVAVTHSRAAALGARRYVPHPLYRHGPVQPRAVSDWGLPAQYFVMFGVITPYKKIDEVIQHFPADRYLVIAGAVGDEEYVQHIRSLQRPNILVRAGFIGDTEAQALVARATALLIAHADADVIVSGSFFFAASVGTPVLAVATPFLRSIEAEFGPGFAVPAADVKALCHSAAGFERTDTAAFAAQAEQAFGDDAVVAAWAPLLPPEGR